MLDEVRGMLEDLGGDLGVTDPVSGESVVRFGPPKPAIKKPTAKRGAKKGAGKRKATKKTVKRRAGKGGAKRSAARKR
jgi:hypothetical protein